MPSLRILYTSDTHGWVLPTDYVSPGLRPLGLARLIDGYHKDGQTLVIDGGDTLQGSPFAAWLHRSQTGPVPLAQGMNLGGYDYVTLGNHDFNFGVDYLAQYLHALNANVLCANIRDRSGLLPVRPYAIHTLADGTKIGLTGVCTHHVRVWETPATLALLEIEEPLPAAQRALAAMRGQCDLTVCIYHGGFERDVQSGALLSQSDENQAWQLCREGGFDLVLTGHQHLLIPGVQIGSTYSVQPGYKAAAALEIRAQWDKGQRPAFSCRVLGATQPPHAALLRHLAPLEAQVQSWLDTPCGRLDRPLPPGQPLQRALDGSYLANFVNQVMRHVSGAPISACALANQAHGFGRQVTVRQVVAAYVYANTMAVIALTGAQLRRYLEHTASYFAYDAQGRVTVSPGFLRPKAEHYQYDFFSGLDYWFDLSRPVGRRVVRLQTMDGMPVNEAQAYDICITSYRRSGAGGYDMLPGAPLVRDIQRDIADCIIEYLESRPLALVDTHSYLHVLPRETRA